MNRKPILVGAVLGLLGLVVLIFGAGYLVLRSHGFGRYAIGKIVEATNEATGGRTEIQGFDFRPSSLTATLYGVTVHGTEASGSTPLFQLDRLTIGIKIESLFGRKFTVRE